jgi:two-component system response regulator QseB
VSESNESRPSVLVADDEVDLAENIATYLARAGFEVVVVNSGAAALEQLRTRLFDVALLDLRMPSATGLEVAAWIRRFGSTTRIILMSAVCSDDTDFADAWLEKPFELTRLRLLLVELLRMSAKARGY